MLVLKVTAAFDSEANVWYVSDSNVPGLVTEASTLEALRQKVFGMIPDLLRLNKHEVVSRIPAEIPLEFRTQERIRLEAA